MGESFNEGFKYPFNNWKRLFNYYWVLIPILGLFTLIGYIREILENLLNKKDKELPEFKGFWRLTKKGFIFFLVSLAVALISVIVIGILSVILNAVNMNGLIFFVVILLEFFIVFLILNYVKKNKFEAVFDVKKAWKVVSKDWVKTIMAILLQILLAVVFLLMSIPIITLIVTIPAMSFTSMYFLTDLYNKQA